MAKYVIEDTTLTGIADAIRTKIGGTDPIPVTDMAAQISAIAGGDSAEGGGSVEGIAYVTFMSGDVELCKTVCMAGDSTVDPVEDGKIAVPTKEPTVSTVYIYAGGWSLTDGGEADEMALIDVTEDRVVYAAYNESVREYTINFYDDDGTTLLERLQVPYGEVPSPATSEKEGYALTEWSPELSAVTGDMDYTAVWIEADTVVAEGTCGDALTWSLNSAGVLTIAGTGEMYNTYTATHQAAPAPWSEHEADIKAVVIEEGVTSVGQYAFDGGYSGPYYQSLTSVVFPESMVTIGYYAFYDVPLTEIIIPGNVTTIRQGAFCQLYIEETLVSAVFIDPDGWLINNSSVSSQVLSDPSVAADYLSKNGKYCIYVWQKS